MAQALRDDRPGNSSSPSAVASRSESAQEFKQTVDAVDARDRENADLRSRLAALEDLLKGVGVASGVAVEGLGSEFELWEYNPKVDPSRPTTQSYVMLPVPLESPGVNPEDPPVVTLNTVTFIPGVQKMTVENGALVMASKASLVQRMLATGAIRRVAETADLRLIEDDMKAQEIISRTEGPSLLAAWAKTWNELRPIIRERLQRREKELQLQATASTRTVFGQTILS